MHRLKLVGGTDIERGSCGANTDSAPHPPHWRDEPASLGSLVFAVVMRCGSQIALIEAQAGGEGEEETPPAC